MRSSELSQHEHELLASLVAETHFGRNRRAGKVRDLYPRGGRLGLVATDRLSAFDRAITTVPLKGRILNLLSEWWFAQTREIVPNAVLATPHPQLTVMRECRTLPLEFVVRGYLTGSTSTSLWTRYRAGERNFGDHVLPENLRKNDRLPQPLLTPTTKGDLHDDAITGGDAIARGLLSAPEWEQASTAALALFQRGSEVAERAGFVLADTKYEFGVDDKDTVVLLDEVHTPDSSRFWRAESLPGRLARGEEPESADKEYLRLWYADRCDPYRDEVLPEAPEELRLELTRRYLHLYEALTGGHEIPFSTGEQPLHDLKAALAEWDLLEG